MNDVVLPSKNPEINGILWKHQTKIPYVATASTENYNDPSVVFDFTRTEFEDYWHGEGNETTISIEFLQHRIQIAFYSFQTFNFSCDEHSHSKSWNFYGTTIKGEEILLDTVNESNLCGNLLIRTKEVYSNSFFKSFKFMMTGRTYANNFKFTIYKVDFYGRIQSLHLLNSCTVPTLHIKLSHLFLMVFIDK